MILSAIVFHAARAGEFWLPFMLGIAVGFLVSALIVWGMGRAEERDNRVY